MITKNCMHDITVWVKSESNLSLMKEKNHFVRELMDVKCQTTGGWSGIRPQMKPLIFTKRKVHMSVLTQVMFDPWGQHPALLGLRVMSCLASLYRTIEQTLRASNLSRTCKRKHKKTYMLLSVPDPDPEIRGRPALQINWSVWSKNKCGGGGDRPPPDLPMTYIAMEQTEGDRLWVHELRDQQHGIHIARKST